MPQSNALRNHLTLSNAEAARTELEKLAAEQGAQPITDIDLLRADFWPEKDSVDEFVRTYRARRQAEGRRSLG